MARIRVVVLARTRAMAKISVVVVARKSNG